LNATVAGRATPVRSITRDDKPDAPATPRARAVKAEEPKPPEDPKPAAEAKPRRETAAPAELVLEDGVGPAPEELRKGNQFYLRLAQELSTLKVNGWKVWKGAPLNKYRQRIRTIANRTGMNLVAYLDADRRVIVKRLPDPTTTP